MIFRIYVYIDKISNTVKWYSSCPTRYFIYFYQLRSIVLENYCKKLLELFSVYYFTFFSNFKHHDQVGIKLNWNISIRSEIAWHMSKNRRNRFSWSWWRTASSVILAMSILMSIPTVNWSWWFNARTIKCNRATCGFNQITLENYVCTRTIHGIFNPLYCNCVECDSTSVFISETPLSSPTRHSFRPTFSCETREKKARIASWKLFQDIPYT